MMLIPFGYGMIQVGVLGAIYGALATGMSLLTIWTLCAYRTIVLRRDFLAASNHQLIADKSKLELAYKVEQGLREETQADLVASRDVVKDLLREITELNAAVCEARTKDAMIEALRRRVKNISEEYNDKHGGPRRATTLADVYKLTGEADVR